MGGSVKMYKKEYTERKVYSNKSHLLNLKTGYWYELDDMPEAMEMKGILVGNLIYTVGGHRLTSLKNISTYNLSTGEWDAVAELPEIMERPGLAYHEGILYIFEQNRIYTYNLDTKVMKKYFIGIDLMFAEMFYHDGMLYILGGQQGGEPSQGFTIERAMASAPDLYRVSLDEFRKTMAYD